mmetsp:Transcript_1929/g.4881  ORF Transcript_1929/g.4881 Transcript_1929/m.4881 type:complete len:312 (-) Transcript_1929:172-1107(-)
MPTSSRPSPLRIAATRPSLATGLSIRRCCRRGTSATAIRSSSTARHRRCCRSAWPRARPSASPSSPSTTWSAPRAPCTTASIIAPSSSTAAPSPSSTTTTNAAPSKSSPTDSRGEAGPPSVARRPTPSSPPRSSLASPSPTATSPAKFAPTQPMTTTTTSRILAGPATSPCASSRSSPSTRRTTIPASRLRHPRRPSRAPDSSRPSLPSQPTNSAARKTSRPNSPCGRPLPSSASPLRSFSLGSRSAVVPVDDAPCRWDPPIVTATAPTIGRTVHKSMQIQRPASPDAGPRASSACQSMPEGYPAIPVVRP